MAEKKKFDITENESDKKKALATTIAQIEKSYGKGAIMKLGENTNMSVSAVSTGSLSLDLALGIGGVPRGRIIEIYGPESSGKTTVALHVIAEVQKLGGEAAFIDAEHALDPVYAKALGVDIDSLLVSQPDNGEQALEITEALVRSGAVEVVVVDSVAALVPRAEIDGEMGDSHVGLQARLMSQALRKLSGAIAKSNCIVIFINQLRLKVGVLYLPEAMHSSTIPPFVLTSDVLKQSKTVQKLAVTTQRLRSLKIRLHLPSKRQNLTFYTAREFQRKAKLLTLQ